MREIERGRMQHPISDSNNDRWRSSSSLLAIWCGRDIIICAAERNEKKTERTASSFSVFVSTRYPTVGVQLNLNVRHSLRLRSNSIFERNNNKLNIIMSKMIDDTIRMTPLACIIHHQRPATPSHSDNIVDYGWTDVITAFLQSVANQIAHKVYVRWPQPTHTHSLCIHGVSPLSPSIICLMQVSANQRIDKLCICRSILADAHYLCNPK